MERYIVVDGDYADKTPTEFDYEIGEILRFNSTSRVKCVGKEEKDGEINYLFKEGKQVFIFE